MQQYWYGKMGVVSRVQIQAKSVCIYFALMPLRKEWIYFFFQHKQYEGTIWKCQHGWFFVLFERNKIIPKIL